jgi:formyltetrahydrofolate deformylase
MSSPRPSEQETAVLLVSCPDRRGIVAALAQVLHGHGANILDADQHTDPLAGQFFQRIRFDLSELMTDRVSLERGIGEVAARFSMRFRLSYAAQRKRVAIFVSRYEHCLVDLLWRHRAGELRCEIALIVSNHPDLRGTAEHYGIPFEVFEITKQNKVVQEARETALLEQSRIDVLVLARYMQILSGAFIERFPNRIINIHHSFLPAFIGARPYRQAFDRGVKLIGATAHFVTDDLDEGPIVEQDVIHVGHAFSADDMARAGRDVEKSVLSRALELVLNERVFVYGNKTVVFK